MASTVKVDVDIQRDVVDELAFDPAVDAAEVGVMIDDGVVTLIGSVGSFPERWAAERAARRVDGVRAVANEITVSLTGHVPIEDAQIAKRIASAFERNILVPKGIDIRVTRGGVTLEGEAKWQYQRDTAERVARSSRGVKWISNQIRVVQPPVDRDEITKGIKQALVRHAAVDADRVHVAVDGGHVTLTGTVRSWAERQEAQEAAWRAKGVTAVTNTIAVQPYGPPSNVR